MSKRNITWGALLGFLAATTLSVVVPVAAHASTPYYPYSSVSCYLGDPNGQPGAFVSAGTGQWTFAGAQTVCTAASTGHGTYLYFQNIAKQGSTEAKMSFTIEGVTQSEPGTHFKWTWLNRVLVFDVEGPGSTTPEWHSHCPDPTVLKHLQLNCRRGQW